MTQALLKYPYTNRKGNCLFFPSKGSSFQTAGERGAIAREECLQLPSLLKGKCCDQKMSKYLDGSGSVVVNRFIPRVLEYISTFIYIL